MHPSLQTLSGVSSNSMGGGAIIYQGPLDQSYAPNVVWGTDTIYLRRINLSFLVKLITKSGYQAVVVLL